MRHGQTVGRLLLATRPVLLLRTRQPCSKRVTLRVHADMVGSALCVLFVVVCGFRVSEFRYS